MCVYCGNGIHVRQPARAMDVVREYGVSDDYTLQSFLAMYGIVFSREHHARLVQLGTICGACSERYTSNLQAIEAATERIIMDSLTRYTRAVTRATNRGVTAWTYPRTEVPHA